MGLALMTVGAIVVFAVILADTKLANGRDRIADLVAKIGVSRYKYKHLGEARWVQFTVSAGVTEFVKGDDVESLVQRADEALYQAKRRGKNRVMTKKKGLGRAGARGPGATVARHQRAREADPVLSRLR